MTTAPLNAAPAGMLQTIVDAICDRPEDTAAQRAIRSRAVVAAVEGFRPHDAVEIMLAGMVVIHANLLEDSAQDVFRGQDDRLKARTKATIVALGRGMFGFLKELRAIQSQRAAAASGTAADAYADAVPLPAGKPAVAPQTGSTAADPPPQTRTPDSPVPVWAPLRRAETSATAMPAVVSPPTQPPLHRAETSVAAMLAVVSPPMPRYVRSRSADKPVPAGHVTASAPVCSATALAA